MTTPDLPLGQFRHIVFFTGAGLSAESGIPTYRGGGGTWDTYDYKLYACQRAFDRNPDLVWDFHDERRRLMSKADPTLGHRIIGAVQQACPQTTIITQNIDGLQQRAGATEVIELHGSVWRVRCHCGDSPQTDTEVPIEDRRCAMCGAWRRPDIVWFEDPLPAAVIDRATSALADCDLLLSIGTSGLVYPAADLPRLARRAGATCVEINPEPTPVSDWYGVHMREPASAALAALWPEMAATCAP